MDAIIIPAYEPDRKLVEIVKELCKKNYVPIVVDDGSGEKYRDIFQEIGENVIVICHKKNQGKGYAIKTAIDYILKYIPEIEYAAIMDADGQHKIIDAERVLEKAKKEKNALVLGMRTFKGNVPFASKAGNIITRKLFWLSSGLKLQDTQTGLRAFPRMWMRCFVKVEGKRYEYEMNVLYKCAKEKIPVKEICIQTIYENGKNESSHFRKCKDSFRIYKQIMKFFLSSFSSFIVDYVLFIVFDLFLGAMPAGILISNILARVFSASFNYHMNQKYVFEQKRTAKGVGAYIALAAGILFCNNAILYMLTLWIGISPIFAKILTEMILFSVSFLVQNLLVFSKKELKEAM